MTPSDSQFRLREMQPADSAAVVSLITDFEGDMTTRFLIDAYTAITVGTEHRTVGVVVERDGFDGLVGMGTVRFDQVQYNGEILPLAFLDGLQVHKDFRGQGLGYQIADWRIRRAKETLGDHCIIATGMLRENLASHAVAQKWCREFIEPAFTVAVLPTRKQRPKIPAGITVREIEPREYEEFAARQNEFYRDHNLYPVREAASIANARAVSADGRKPYRFFAAVDGRGSLRAGAQTWARGLIKCDTMNHPPAPLAIMNRLLHVLPSDWTIRDIDVSALWYEPGEFRAARGLFEMIRWECREQGSVLVTHFDARDPAWAVMNAKPWHQPRLHVTLSIQAPQPIDRGKLLYASGRV